MFGVTFNLVTRVGDSQRFVKYGIKKTRRLKLQISCSLDHTILFKLHLHVVQTIFNEYMERLPISALATV